MKGNDELYEKVISKFLFPVDSSLFKWDIAKF